MLCAKRSNIAAQRVRRKTGSDTSCSVERNEDFCNFFVMKKVALLLLLFLLASLSAGLVVTPMYNSSGGVNLPSDGPNPTPLVTKYNGALVLVVLRGNATGKRVLQAYDAASGSALPGCSVDTGGEQEGSMFVDAESNMVVFATADGALHGWRLCDAKLAWTAPLDGAGYYYGVKDGSSGVALILTGNSGGASIFAVSTLSGKVLWKRKSNISFPSVGCGLIWTTESSGSSWLLVGRDPLTGQVSSQQTSLALSQKPAQFVGGTFRCASPLTFFYSCTGRQTGLCAVGGATWQYYPQPQTRTPYMWPSFDPEEPDAVYGSCNDCFMYAFNAQNGTVRWLAGGACGSMAPLLPSVGPLKRDYVVYGSFSSVRIFSRANGTALWTGPPVRFFSDIAMDFTTGDIYLVPCNTVDCNVQSLIRWQSSAAIQAPEPQAVIEREDYSNTICTGNKTVKKLSASSCNAEGESVSCTPFGALSTSRYHLPNCQGGIARVLFDYPEGSDVVFSSELCRQTAWGSYVILKCRAH